MDNNPIQTFKILTTLYSSPPNLFHPKPITPAQFLCPTHPPIFVDKKTDVSLETKKMHEFPILRRLKIELSSYVERYERRCMRSSSREIESTGKGNRITGDSTFPLLFSSSHLFQGCTSPLAKKARETVLPSVRSHHIGERTFGIDPSVRLLFLFKLEVKIFRKGVFHL